MNANEPSAEPLRDHLGWDMSLQCKPKPREAEADPDTAFELGRVAGYDEAMREVQGEPSDALYKAVEQAIHLIGAGEPWVAFHSLKAALRAASAVTERGETDD